MPSNCLYNHPVRCIPCVRVTSLAHPFLSKTVMLGGFGRAWVQPTLASQIACSSYKYVCLCIQYLDLLLCTYSACLKMWYFDATAACVYWISTQQVAACNSQVSCAEWRCNCEKRLGERKHLLYEGKQLCKQTKLFKNAEGGKYPSGYFTVFLG